MREEPVDFVCDREEPETILDTVQAIKAGSSDFSNVPSLWWRSPEGSVRSNWPGDLVADLDREMPGISWDLLPMNRYRAHNWHGFDHIKERSASAAAPSTPA